MVHIAEWAHLRVKCADVCALLELGCWVCCAGGGRGGAAGAGSAPIVRTVGFAIHIWEVTGRYVVGLTPVLRYED